MPLQSELDYWTPKRPKINLGDDYVLPDAPEKRRVPKKRAAKGEKPARERPVVSPIKNALMVKTIDQRQFFTDTNNYPQLIEFGRSFNAQISVVKTDGVLPLSLEELAKSLCDPERGRDVVAYEVIEERLKSAPVQTPVEPFPIDLKKKSRLIMDYVRKEFLAGNLLNIKAVSSKFSGVGVGATTLAGYFHKTRRQMESEGYKFHKEGRGNYRLTLSKSQVDVKIEEVLPVPASLPIPLPADSSWTPPDRFPPKAPEVEKPLGFLDFKKWRQKEVDAEFEGYFRNYHSEDRLL